MKKSRYTHQPANTGCVAYLSKNHHGTQPPLAEPRQRPGVDIEFNQLLTPLAPLKSYIIFQAPFFKWLVLDWWSQ